MPPSLVFLGTESPVCVLSTMHLLGNMELSGKKKKKGEREESYRKIFPFCTFLNFALTLQT